MTMLASQITSLTVVYSIVYSGVNQRKHQSSASLAIVREIHRGPVNFPHKWPVTRKMFPFDDVIMVLFRNNYDYLQCQLKGSSYGMIFLTLCVTSLSIYVYFVKKKEEIMRWNIILLQTYILQPLGTSFTWVSVHDWSIFCNVVFRPVRPFVRQADGLMQKRET